MPYVVDISIYADIDIYVVNIYINNICYIYIYIPYIYIYIYVIYHILTTPQGGRG